MAKLIRVAFLIDTISCATAGTQKQLLETIRRLDRDSFEPHLICLWESDWMIANSLPCPSTVLGYQGFVSLDFPGVVWRLKKLIFDKRFHIIQTFFEDSIFVTFFAALLTRPRPILLSSRRDMGLGKGNQPWYHGIFAKLLPYVNKLYSGIITNSRQVRLYAAKREKTPVSKIKVIPNGVAIPEKPQDIPPIFREVQGDIWIGLVASLTRVKQHDLLLRAYAKIQGDLPNYSVQILFLGDGEEHDRLEKLARDLQVEEGVHFLGAVKDVAAYLYNLDIGVLCSDREGLSNAILEYMACSLPVVATEVGGNTELVDSENGISVPPGDADALAEAITQLIVNAALRKKLGAGSLAKMKRTFSWDKAMVELEDYYRSLVLHKEK